MKKRKGKTNLARKQSKLKREAINTIGKGLGYTPAGPVLTTIDTAKGIIKTKKAAEEYLDALGNETKRNIKKRLTRNR